MNMKARNQNPKIDMRVSLSAPLPFDEDEEAAAQASHRKALEARNLSQAEIDAEIARVWS